ncbi:efflux RND transporter periplasmic adaptor subunit [Acuticoccus sediminis]|uniref:efflux RND transporter periplasmic adaptor subunit n=1 Tax=Acuticoccus sediminis TaxID=2184697 RepID=UPI001CFF1568|nr:efflux RND transporter periplasmic adaptor subunit [Acuticoccus sediminis]
MQSISPYPTGRHKVRSHRRRLLARIGTGAILSVGVGAVAAYFAPATAPAIAPAVDAAAAVDPRTTAALVKVAVVAPFTGGERAFTGTIAARVESNLGFRVPGKVVERLVDAGQKVTAGQPLMRIDETDLNLSLTQRRKDVDAARAALVQITADEKRYEALAGKGFASRQRYEQAKAALATATATLAAAEAAAHVAENEAAYAVLAADADGTVMETLAEPGQVVAPGETVVRLAHAGAREAVVALPETVRPPLGKNAEAELYGSAGHRSPARLRQLSDTADPQTRTYEARFVLDGDAAQAPLGATVTIRMRSEDDSADVQVPIGAILDDGTAIGVWAVDHDTSTVSFHPITVRRLSEDAAVISGIAAGQEVVALGAHLLSDGASIRIFGERAP